MIFATKQALENTTRQRMLEIRYRELDYYTGCARNLGNQAALISGMAYSGIRYHYLIERQQSYKLTEEDSLEEVMFITLLALTIGCSLQTVFIAMLVSMLGPSLALRGPDGSLHDAVQGMQQWNSVTLAMFSLSLLLLQLSVFSFMYGHKNLGWESRTVLMIAVSTTLAATGRYSRIVLRRFRLKRTEATSGAFFTRLGIFQSKRFKDKGFSKRKPARNLGRVSEDECVGLTAEALDDALNELPAETGATTEDIWTVAKVRRILKRWVFGDKGRPRGSSQGFGNAESSAVGGDWASRAHSCNGYGQVGECLPASAED